MKRLKILPYKMGSQSAKLLSQHLGLLLGRKVFRVRETFRPKLRHQIINWGGRSNIAHNIWNHPGNCARARNKIATFHHLQLGEVPTVEWTVDSQKAGEWLAAGSIVYARLSVEGQGGAGIRLIQNAGDMVAAPLYTKYFSARREYRVHVAFGEMIDYACKKKRSGVEGNKFVRNHENGYVYARTDVALPNSVRSAALLAVSALGLDFGAVDVLHNEGKDVPAVLEVNTAPGLDNHTAERYARAFATRLARV